MIVISDFTVIFSKSQESRAEILGQLRMVYDGEMIKHSGSKDKAMTWSGYLGMLAGSTPSIYAHFEEVADMGERFIYYRMKDYNVENATRRSLDRTIFGKDLDEKLSELYATYIQSCIDNSDQVPQISPLVYERILSIAIFAAKLRTPTHYDRYSRTVDRVPIPEMPMRIASQLRTIARGLSVMRYWDTGSWELSEDDIQYIEWCAYSLANEERRSCLREMARFDFEVYMKTQTIGDKIGLDTSVAQVNLQHLASIGIVIRDGDANGLSWAIKDKEVWQIVRRLLAYDEIKEREEDRALSMEEMSRNDTLQEIDF